MTISLTCGCGARLDIDETFAGKTISCPDCQRSLNVPRPEQPGVKTSGFALTSLTLALVGGFTVIGPLAAVGFGFLGLRDVARKPDQVAGRGYALAGIVVGGLVTVLTGLALFSGGLLGLNNLTDRMRWAGKLDYPPELEVNRPNEGYKIARPSAKWGIYRPMGTQAMLDLRPGRFTDNLVMVNLEDDAYLVVLAPEMVPREWGLDTCKNEALRKFREQDKVGLFGQKRDTHHARMDVIETKHRPPVGMVESVEMLVDKAVGWQERRFLLRVVKQREDTQMFVLIAGARKSHFDAVAADLRRALDSFTLTGRGNLPGDWR